MKFNVGVTRCAKAIDCLLMHTFNQQKFNLVFSSDTLAISPSCFVLTDVVLNESSSQQHIKNYRGNMNVCVAVLKKCHPEGNRRTKHQKEKKW